MTNWTNSYGDHATITLTDDRGRTVCQFVKEKADSGWIVADGPGSRKHIQRMIKLVEEGEDLPPMRRGHLGKAHLTRRPDGQCYLDAPGLYLRWEKVTPILDGLHEHAIRKISVSQFRDCIR